MIHLNMIKGFLANLPAFDSGQHSETREITKKDLGNSNNGQIQIWQCKINGNTYPIQLLLNNSVRKLNLDQGMVLDEITSILSGYPPDILTAFSNGFGNKPPLTISLVASEKDFKDNGMNYAAAFFDGDTNTIYLILKYANISSISHEFDHAALYFKNGGTFYSDDNEHLKYLSPSQKRLWNRVCLSSTADEFRLYMEKIAEGNYNRRDERHLDRLDQKLIKMGVISGYACRSLVEFLAEYRNFNYTKQSVGSKFSNYFKSFSKTVFAYRGKNREKAIKVLFEELAIAIDVLGPNHSSELVRLESELLEKIQAEKPIALIIKEPETIKEFRNENYRLLPNSLQLSLIVSQAADGGPQPSGLINIGYEFNSPYFTAHTYFGMRTIMPNKNSDTYLYPGLWLGLGFNPGMLKIKEIGLFLAIEHTLTDIKEFSPQLPILARLKTKEGITLQAGLLRDQNRDTLPLFGFGYSLNF